MAGQSQRAPAHGEGGLAVEMTRRDFFKASAAGGAAVAWGSFGFDLTRERVDKLGAYPGRLHPGAGAGCQSEFAPLNDDLGRQFPNGGQCTAPLRSPAQGGERVP